MSKLLVKFDTNWADEMDISGYKVFTEIEWNEISDKCKAHNNMLEAYFRQMNLTFMIMAQSF